MRSGVTELAAVYRARRDELIALARAAVAAHPALAGLAELVADAGVVDWPTAEGRLRAHTRALVYAGDDLTAAGALLRAVEAELCDRIVEAHAGAPSLLRAALALVVELGQRIAATLCDEQRRVAEERYRLVF